MSDVEIHALLPDGPRRLPTPPGVASLHAVDLPDGIYEGLRTFAHDRFLYLERHLDRARRSMRALGWEEPLDEPALRRGLDAVVRAFPHADAAVRIDVFEHALAVHGVETRAVCVLAPFRPVDPALIERGVDVGVARGKARFTPPVKRNEWIARRRGVGPGDGGRFEHLLLDPEERILEGTSCNVFCVRGRRLLTAESDVLFGIQRGVFLELAAREGIETAFEAVRLDAIAELDEMFLTSSSRALVPITSVEGAPVGSGRPGPIARLLLERYAALARDVARPAVERARS